MSRRPRRRRSIRRHSRAARRASRGYNGGKKINGRKRHLIVDSLGLLLVVPVTSANLDDGAMAPRVLELLTPEQRSRLDEIRGDGKYNNRTLDRHPARINAAYKITVVERPTGVKGRTLALPLGHSAEQRLNGDIPSKQQGLRTHDGFGRGTMVHSSMIHFMLRRLKPDTSAQKADFHYP